MRRPCLDCGTPTTGPRCEDHQRNRDSNLARKLLDWVYERDNARCRIGGEFVPRPDATLDHIVPFSRGGTDHPTNLRLACRSHNSARNSF